MKRNVVLIIRDGWGINKNTKFNAVANAKTVNIPAYLKKYPNAVLKSSGCAVGLPAGYQGSSEVGHLNIGAGRIIKQEITRINEAIENGAFFSNKNFINILNNAHKNMSSIHVMGLVQDEGVHAHQDHLFSILRFLADNGFKKVYIHFFADGRDTPPRSAKKYISILNNKIAEFGVGTIASVMGRYFSMDRGQNWDITDKAYNAIVDARGLKSESAELAVEYAYKKLKTPSGSEMFDEYIPPTIINNYNGINDGDSVIHFNYRQDRAIQLTQAFIEDDYPGSRSRRVDVAYCGLTKYYDSFNHNVLDAIDNSIGMKNLLGEVISNTGVKQLRISETQKFRHVTSFLNGKKIKPFNNEYRIEIKSTYDPSDYANHPEMNAFEVTERVIKEIDSNEYALIIINYANCDMVGHTGNFKSAIRAVEIVDYLVGQVVDAILENDAIALITADHGNLEEMVEYETGEPKTSHTTNPVEFIYVAKDHEYISLEKDGILSDMAPTILYLLGIEIPKDMTSKNLILGSP